MRGKKPYTYRIGWSELGLYYYGVRTANRLPPEDDLWTEYFTSSPNVEVVREHHGEPDIIEVRRTFDLKRRAQYWESEVIRRIAYYNPSYLNGVNSKILAESFS